MVAVEAIDELVAGALLGAAGRRVEARHAIRRQAAAAGIWPASILPFYRARAAGTGDRLTVPAINVRGLSYDFIRAVIRAAQARQVGAFILEIARSEMAYTDQRPDDLVVIGLASALREGYRGPLFFQGDHYQVKPERGIDGEVRTLEQLVDESMAAGFYNLDVDASTTVDLTQPDPRRQQAQNVALTARLTSYIRRHQPVPVNIGGEIGEIGGQVSTVSDLRAFMEAYRALIPADDGISKVAVQTGTRHGGRPDAAGRPSAMSVDFAAVAELTRVARSEFGLAGVVQHGASTLPLDTFDRFPDAGTAEIHLSTEFQNLIFEHEQFPAELRLGIDQYCFEHFGRERTVGETDAQFLYRHRKHAWGPFKRQLIDVPAAVRSRIGQSLEDFVASLFERLRVVETRPVVDRLVKR
ncbi:MAG: class II fructose-bisphosphate aldolase [Candidatus Kerfeldbacteria bacterium]|nr:class II fructose-bisphosphate aldolase [Candidatus Kerfeldbacteria bacterium]